MQSRMRSYNYSVYGSNNAYGQPSLTQNAGTIKMAISDVSTEIGESSPYSKAQYIGLTNDAITDKYIIHYGDIKLKVIYITPTRLKQVFMARM